MKKKSAAAALCLLSFFIPFVIVILAYIGLHIEPFGDKTLFISDARALYLSELSSLSRFLRGQEDLLYSFKMGPGLNMLGSYSNLLNPANVIVLLFDITGYSTMYALLTAIDISFCGLTMYLFLSSIHGEKNANLIFSTVYALIGFNVANCFQYNFFLCVELLPVMALGIRRIIEGRAPWLYLIALAYSIFASFYNGYMLCIASVVLFLKGYAEQRERLKAYRKKVWTNYIGASLIAGLLPAIVWLPSLISLAGGRLEQNSWLDFSFVENMSLQETGAKLFVGANNLEQIVSGFPNIFCGTFVVFLAFAFFIDRNNTVRNKLTSAVPIAFYFVTFYIKALSMAMQGFSETNWYNFRYSYVFSFLLILMACEEFSRFREISREDLKRTCFAYLAFVIFVFARSYSFVNAGGMLLGLAILALILGAICWNRVDERRAPRRVMIMLILLLCSIESYANYVICTHNLTQWMKDTEEFEKTVFVESILSDGVLAVDDSFYRMASETGTMENCNNDPRLFGYDGVNYFGSCEKTFVFQGMSKLGMAWWSNRMWYGKEEPAAFDALMGLKYVVSKGDPDEVKGYQRLTGYEDTRIFRNPNALPVGILAAPASEAVALGRNPFENHNALWKSLAGSKDDVFTQEEDIRFEYHEGIDGAKVSYGEALEFASTQLSSASNASEAPSESAEDADADSDKPAQSPYRYIECTFTAGQDGPIYSYNGFAVDDDSGANKETMHYVGTFHAGDLITDRIPVDASLTDEMFKAFCSEYHAAYENTDALAAYCGRLQRGSGSLEKRTDSRLIGEVNAGGDGRLFFTIPYDEGWTLKLDGEKIDLHMSADLFMEASVPAGEHTYELTFFPKGMKAGMVISASAAALLLLLIGLNIAMLRREKSGTA